MNLGELREESTNLVKKLDMPSSIRTPGRTWTRYPERLDEKLEDSKKEISPEIKSSGNVDVFSGRKALEEAGEKAFNLIRKDENRLNALHTSNINSFIFIRAEDNSEIKLQYQENSPVISHVVIIAGKNSDVKLTEETLSEDFNTSFTEIYVEENATVDYAALEKPEGFSYSRRKALVKKYGSINWLNSIFKGDLNRTKIETILKGDNSETEMTSVWYPTDKQHHDISLHVRHIGDNTKCDMDSRSVVDHKGRSIYEGLQKVERTAEETSSFQDQETLMLSDKAESDASPKLMIENPDVEASHAAAAGTVEKPKQHYLESRGLTKDKAERLVVKGFFEPVMQEIETPEIKKEIRNQVEKKLDEKSQN